MDRLYCDLNISNLASKQSVHLAIFPEPKSNFVDTEMEERMDIAQQVCSMAFALRKKAKIRVRQPLHQIAVVSERKDFYFKLASVEAIILEEINVKHLMGITQSSFVVKRKIKANFKTIGKKYGKQMKALADMISKWDTTTILGVEQNNGWKGEVLGENIELDIHDFEISTDEILGWMTATENGITVGLKTEISDELKQEGIAREIINRVQGLRKDSGLEVTDKINVTVDTNELVKSAIEANKRRICEEVLANEIVFGKLDPTKALDAELEEGVTFIGLVKS
jgi:isoleucyl-tRNA synthetase